MRIVIAGAGLTGRRLAASLVTGRHDVVMVDVNRELCEAASAEFGVVAVCGNATDISVLEEAEIERAAVGVAMMRESADNLAFSLLARGAGVERIIARMPNPRYRAAYERAGVTSIIDVTGLFLDRLVFEIERPPVDQVASIADGQGAVVWVRVADGSAACGRPLEEIRADRRFPHGCVVSGLIRADSERLLFPSGRDRLLAGDRVLFVGTIEGLTRAADLVGTKRGILSLFSRDRRARVGRDEEAHARLEASLEESEETNAETLEDPSVTES
jgi:trk system potassium uptake protein TrkA